MDEKVFELSFEIIGYAGNAKGIAFEAIEKAKTGDIDGAREMLKESKEESNKAHRCQTELIQQEASGNHVVPSILLMHAEDQLMSAETIKVMALEIIRLNERVKALEKY